METEVEPTSAVEKSRYFNRMDEAFGILCLSISPELLFHVESCSTPNQVWKFLEELFGKQNEMLRIVEDSIAIYRNSRKNFSLEPEDPHVASLYATNYVQGLQETDDGDPNESEGTIRGTGCACSCANVACTGNEPKKDNVAAMAASLATGSGQAQAMNPALTSMGSLNSPLQTLNPPLNPGLSSALNPALSNSLLGATPPLHHSGPFPAFYDQHPQPPPQHSQPLYSQSRSDYEPVTRSFKGLSGPLPSNVAAELYNAPNFLMQGLAKGASGMAGLSRARLAPPTQRFGASASNRKFALCLPSTGSYTGSFRNKVMAISAKGDSALQHFLSHDQENFKPNPITVGTSCRWSVKKLDIAILEQLHQRGNCAGGTDFRLVFVQRREAEQRGRGVLAGRHRVPAAEHLDHGLDGPFFHNQCFVRLVDAQVEERRHGVLLSLGVVALQDVNTVVTTWKGISVMDPVLCQIGRTEVLRDIVYLYKHVLEDFLDLYIADAYFGLLTVGPEGGLATPLTTEARGVPVRFTNDLDIDDYALERPPDWVVRIRLHVAQQIAGNM